MQITFAISKTKTASLHDDVEIGRSFWLSAIFRRHNTRTRGGTEHPTKRPKATSTERALVVFFRVRYAPMRAPNLPYPFQIHLGLRLDDDRRRFVKANTYHKRQSMIDSWWRTMSARASTSSILRKPILYSFCNRLLIA